MEHKQTLAELYGRIGQVLQEHGDAPIGHFKEPISKPCMPDDWVRPKYVEPFLQTLEVDGVKIKCYDLNVF